MRNFTRVLLVLCWITATAVAWAGAALPPGPPAANPHPPQTVEERARVEFGDLALRTVLMPPGERGTQAFVVNVHGLHLNWSAECLRDARCMARDTKRAAYAASIRSSLGTLLEFRFTHVIPWSWSTFERARASHQQKRAARAAATTAPSERAALTEPSTTDRSMRGDQPKIRGEVSSVMPLATPRQESDEYLLHSYARFSYQPDTWYHVDTVVTENARGVRKLRRFFILPMPAASSGRMPPGVVCWEWLRDAARWSVRLS